MPDWDEKYAAAPDGLFGSAPNEFVRESVARSDVEPGRALMIADGDGRNGRWLAARGWTVTALDISAVGTRHALALDAAAGVSVERCVADIESWRPATAGHWHAAFLIYLQGPPQLRMAGVRAACDSLSPGGHLIMEGFCADPVSGSLPPATLGPTQDRHRYTMAEIAAALGDRVTFVVATTGIVRLQEGRGHDGCGRVVRVIARKR